MTDDKKVNKLKKFFADHKREVIAAGLGALGVVVAGIGISLLTNKRQGTGFSYDYDNSHAEVETTGNSEEVDQIMAELNSQILEGLEKLEAAEQA